MEKSLIHPTAIIHPGAHIGAGTRIGAYSIIEDDVTIGEGCDLREHVIVRGHTRIGDECKLFSFSVAGEEPQHLGYKGEPTTTVLGNRVTLRESATVHRGSLFGTGTTLVGDEAYIMAYSHVAHDCAVGRNVILANSVQLAGHVVVEDFVTIGGQSAVAQHCRVGRYCYVGGGSILRKDLPPFLLGKGNPFEVQGVNAVGLNRHGFSDSTVMRLRKLFKIFYLQKLTIAQAMEKILTELGETDEVQVFLEFAKNSKLGFIR